MFYRMIVSVGLFALGYYVGREVGRTESIREQLRRGRETGGTVNLRDAVVIDMEQPASQQKQQPVKH